MMNERQQRVYDVLFPGKTKYRCFTEAQLMLDAHEGELAYPKLMGLCRAVEYPSENIPPIVVAATAANPACADQWLAVATYELRNEHTSAQIGFLWGTLLGFFRSVAWLDAHWHEPTACEDVVPKLLRWIIWTPESVQTCLLGERSAENSSLGEAVKLYVRPPESSKHTTREKRYREVHTLLLNVPVMLKEQSLGLLGRVILDELTGKYLGGLRLEERLELLKTYDRAHNEEA